MIIIIHIRVYPWRRTFIYRLFFMILLEYDIWFYPILVGVRPTVFSVLAPTTFVTFEIWSKNPDISHTILSNSWSSWQVNLDISTSYIIVQCRMWKLGHSGDIFLFSAIWISIFDALEFWHFTVLRCYLDQVVWMQMTDINSVNYIKPDLLLNNKYMNLERINVVKVSAEDYQTYIWY